MTQNCTSADTSGAGPDPSFEKRLDTAFSMEAAAGEVHAMSAVQRSATSSNASVIKITLQAHRVSFLAVYGHEQHSAANCFLASPGCMQELMRSRKPDLSAKRAAALSSSGLTARPPASSPAAASHTELRSPSSIMLLAAACTASQAWAATFPTAAWHKTHLCI